MKDAKGHGSGKRRGYAETVTHLAAHQQGVVQATARTPEEYIQAGGKLPTEKQQADYETTRLAWIQGWGPNPAGQGPEIVARLKEEIDQARANKMKFGSEEHPTAYTTKLRKG